MFMYAVVSYTARLHVIMIALFPHMHPASEKAPLLPQGPPPTITGDAPKLIGSALPTLAERDAKPSAGASSSRAARPESLILDQPLVPMKLVSYYLTVQEISTFFYYKTMVEDFICIAGTLNYNACSILIKGGVLILGVVL